ncbi:MAG: DoxX family protein [Gammaproteobacteria bacterium]|nr:DoxX family protein [Gammaproteobacteria bacterium]
MNKYLDLFGRILLSVMFLLSGFNKIGDYALVQGFMASQGVPGILLPLVIALEIVGPLLIIVGWHTRLTASALAGFSVLAAILFHLNFSDQTQMIMFMKNLTIAGGFLVLMAHGPGEISLDFRRKK